MGIKERHYGTMSIGVRAPIIREGDDLVDIVTKSVSDAVEDLGMDLYDKDVIAITESIVARASGNYATVDDIAKDVHEKFGDNTVGVIFPILSRNRFAICLRGIAKGCKKIVLMLSYPSDEVGNKLVSDEVFYSTDANTSYTLTEGGFKSLYGESKHEFTGVNYITYYKELIEGCGCECEVIFSNNPKAILDFTKCVLTCDIHTRNNTKKLLTEAGAVVYGLDDILTKPMSENGGYNDKYGLLGSNKSTEEKIKLFPRTEVCEVLVRDVAERLFNQTGAMVQVMVYGDGAFKDPVGKIWELADPVVSPAYTAGLNGTPNELKLKYLADNDYADLSGDELKEAIQARIVTKESNLVGQMATQGTTPRQLTDLLGSLSDLTSGSGDKGTPIVLIKGYFDNYTNN